MFFFTESRKKKKEADEKQNRISRFLSIIITLNLARLDAELTFTNRVDLGSF